jgi:hypothetical protein
MISFHISFLLGHFRPATLLRVLASSGSTSLHYLRLIMAFICMKPAQVYTNTYYLPYGVTRSHLPVLFIFPV